jgi:hypothetical protein
LPRWLVAIAQDIRFFFSRLEHCDGIAVKECAVLGEYRRNPMGQGILLWLIGVPIPIIILLALFFH